MRPLKSFARKRPLHRPFDHVLSPRALRARQQMAAARHAAILIEIGYLQMQLIRDIFARRAARARSCHLSSFPRRPRRASARCSKDDARAAWLNPDFCSVTYGAGGSTREKTLDIVDRIQREQHHGDGAPDVRQRDRDETAAILEQARRSGSRTSWRSAAIRPDGVGSSSRPRAASSFPTSWFDSSRSRARSRSASPDFPEGHVACREGRHVDWQRLKHKIDHGADFVITQLFFNNAHYFEFRDYLTALGVRCRSCRGSCPSSARPRSSAS